MIITYNQFATYYVGLLLCKRETYTYLQYGTQMPHMLADRHVAWSVLVYYKGITSPETTSIKLTGVRKDLERPEASHNFDFDTFKELSILLGFNPS